MNTLNTGTITIAGENITIKDTEVYINEQPYVKADVEITVVGNITGDPKDVKVGIRSRGNRKEHPAYHTSYTDWKINGTTPASLGVLIEQINTEIR